MKTISVKLPEPLNQRLEKQMAKEDKDNRNAMLCELLDMALRIREMPEKSEASLNNKLDELIEICTTKLNLQMNRAVGELIRYTYSNEKSKYPDCQNADTLLKKIEQMAQHTVDEYKGVHEKTGM